MKFMIQSEKLEKLRPLFDEASALIKEAASKKRQIIIRHHDDVDGYSAGYVLEKAISSLIDDKRGYGLSRSSSRTPYYDYTDALRDLSGFAGYSAPLIILTDLGSNEQSMKAIKRLKAYGVDFIIIDHHIFDEANQELVKVFLNPHIFGFGSDLCAGILCSELAINLNPKLDIHHIPALSAVADKSSGPEIDAYITLSEMDFSELNEWAMLLDHEFFYIKFQVRLNMLDDLFSNEKALMFLKTELESEFDQLRQLARKYLKIKDFNGFKLLRLDRNLVGDYEYPSYKLPRVVHELEEGPHITLIETEESISYRADGVDFDGVKMIDELKRQFPSSMVTGGGHAAAGGIRFNAASKGDIMRFIEEYLC